MNNIITGIIISSLGFLSSCSEELPTSQAFVHVGTFYYQIDASNHDREKVFNAANYAARAQGYSMRERGHYNVYDKNGNKYFMTFSPAEGTNCYAIRSQVLEPSLMDAEVTNFENLHATLKQQLSGMAIYSGAEKCPPYL